MWRARFHEKSRLGPLTWSSGFLAVLACLAGVAVAQQPAAERPLTPFDAENPEHRALYPHLFHTESLGLVGDLFGCPPSVHLGRRYVMDKVQLLEACLEAERAAPGKPERCLRMRIRKELAGQGVRFSSLEEERTAFQSRVDQVVRADFRSQLEHLRSVVGGWTKGADVTIYLVQEASRSADPVRNRIGLVVDDPFLGPTSLVRSRVRLPEKDVSEYRALLRKAFRIVEISFVTKEGMKKPESSLVLARAHRIHEHRARIFAAEEPRVGPVDRRYEEHLRSAVRKRRRALQQKTAPRVASLVEGRAPEDARKAFKGMYAFEGSAQWVACAALEHLWWGVQIGEGRELILPEGRLVEALEICARRFLEAVPRTDGPDPLPYVKGMRRLLKSLETGLAKTLRKEVARTACYETLHDSLWYLHD